MIKSTRKYYLVGGWATPLKKYESIGMIIPNIWENKTWQPNHQPDIMDYEEKIEKN